MIVATTVSAAIPAFVAAIVLILVFAVKLGWFPALGNGDGLRRPAQAPHAAGDRAGDVVAGARRPRDAASVREELRPRARADRGQPRHPVPAGRPPPRAAQRGDPDHHGRRHHDRLADRAVGGGRARVRLNGLGAYLVQAAQSKDFAVVQGISLVLVAAFVDHQHVVDVLYALLDPRVTLGSRAQ